MASGRFSVTRLADASAAAGTAKTMIRLAADANLPFTISSFWISNDDMIAGDAPIKVEILEETVLGDGTGGTSPTPRDLAGTGATSRVTARVNLGTEGSPTLVLLRAYLVPAGQTLAIQLPLGRDDVIAKALAWRMRVTAVTSTANLTYGADWEE